MKKTNGFTLMELIVVASIFLILICAIFAVMDVGNSTWFTAGATVELRQEITKAFLTMEKELKETAPSKISLTAGNSSGSLTFKLPEHDDDGFVLLDPSGIIVWSDDITYALNGSYQITRGTSVLANNIVSLQFTMEDSSVNILRINITAQKMTALGRTVTDTGQLNIKMRN